MKLNKIKSKIFMGGYKNTADEKFNQWVEEKNSEHTKITIKELQFRQANCGDHSICILYEECEATMELNREEIIKSLGVL